MLTLVIAITGCDQIERLIQYPQYTTATRIPYLIPYLVLPIGFGLMSLRLIQDLWKQAKKCGTRDTLIGLVGLFILGLPMYPVMISLYVTGSTFIYDYIDPLPALFVWKAPDGSQVTAERTGGEYMAWTRPALEFNLKESEEGLDEIGYDRMAVFYGVGNHGGGPTIENIRTIYEMREEYPAGTLDFSTMEAFFQKVDPKKLPEVTGELGRIFFGCYSSDREIKQKNRRAEWTLQKAEAISAMAARMGAESWETPVKRLEYAWKEALFNQFHDVLAGTSIEPSRAQACREFDTAISIAEHTVYDGIQAIANALDTRGDGFPLVLVNPCGQEFEGVFAADVYVPRAQKKPLRMRDPKGEEIFCCETGYRNRTPDSRKVILFEAKIPAWGYSVYRVIGEGPNAMEQPPCIRASERMLDNGEFIVYPKSFLRFLFDMRGTFGFPTK